MDGSYSGQKLERGTQFWKTTLTVISKMKPKAVLIPLSKFPCRKDLLIILRVFYFSSEMVIWQFAASLNKSSSTNLTGTIKKLTLHHLFKVKKSAKWHGRNMNFRYNAYAFNDHVVSLIHAVIYTRNTAYEVKIQVINRIRN